MNSSSTSTKVERCNYNYCVNWFSQLQIMSDLPTERVFHQRYLSYVPALTYVVRYSLSTIALTEVAASQGIRCHILPPLSIKVVHIELVGDL